MFFTIALSVSLIIFCTGVAYKLWTWFSKDVGMGEKNIPLLVRFFSALKTIPVLVFSRKLFTLAKTFFVDVIFQKRILKDHEDRVLWAMHMLIFVGFLLLLLVHALGSIIIGSFDPNYQSTLNPFLFLRNLFGLFVLSGLVLALIRRRILQKGRMESTGMDYFVIVLLAVIVVSGFLLEGLKIGSYSAYKRMVEDYATTDEEGKLRALEAYWVQEFGVSSPNVQSPVPEEMLAEGKDVHEMSCRSCHSAPQFAFISYGLSRALSSAALRLDRAGAVSLLWYLHFLACFIGLAYVPFSKMFHILATPVSLLSNSIARIGQETHANAATRHVIELDGCSHGGTCHMECPIRRKRQERIDRSNPFDPMLDYIRLKGWKDLGNRYYEE
jgi:nitrate reductase gamma subunit